MGVSLVFFPTWLLKGGGGGGREPPEAITIKALGLGSAVAHILLGELEQPASVCLLGNRTDLGESGH